MRVNAPGCGVDWQGRLDAGAAVLHALCMNAAARRPAHERATTKETLARRIRRWTLLLGVGALVLGYLCFGARWVPADMDTVPEIPPGSFCVLDKRDRAVQVGSHVFVELPGAGVVLTRVATRDGDRITVRHPNPGSAIPDSRAVGSVPLAAVRGTVLGAFAPDGRSRGGR